MPKRNLLHTIRTVLANPGPSRLAYAAIRRHYAVQSLWELSHLIAEVAALKPATIFEIGTHRGGTLYCWSRILTPDGTLLSLDLPADANDEHTTVPALQQLVVSDRQKCTFLRDDSHVLKTKRRVYELLEGKPVDFLFIDGDHAYEGVKMDFEYYRGLVRSGGLIAFHDIAPNPDVPDYGVAKFWQEVKQGGHKIHEFIDPHPTGPTGMGIGVVSVP